MARATRWTDEKLKAIKLPDGKPEQRVHIEPGLYIHVRRRADGAFSKHWQFRAQVDGVRRWLSLGSYPEVTLAQAHTELLHHGKAHEAAKKGDGDHPVVAARMERKAKKAQPTVQEAFDEWISDKRLGSARKGGAPVRERTVTVLTENYNADIKDRLGDAKVIRLTREAVQGCIDAPRRRGSPGSAAHVYRTLRGLLNFCIKRGYVEGADPMRGIDNPKPYRPAPVVAANDTEILSLLRTLDDSKLWPSTRLAVEFQLLTGARPAEARLARWSEINISRATWTIPSDRVKSGRAFVVHLSKEALGLLERTKLNKPLKNKSFTKVEDYVFPGRNGGALEKMAIARALSRLASRSEGAKRLRPHDLRRTFRTMLSRLGVAPHVAELCMNHQETETMRRVYDGHDYFPEMAAAWDLAGSHIASLLRGGAAVIKFNRA